MCVRSGDRNCWARDLKEPNTSLDLILLIRPREGKWLA